jgi:hypothetical protein
MFFKVIACEVTFREICMAAARSVNLVDLEFLTQGYHDNPDIGRARLQEKIDSLPQGRYDAVLLVYALCNNMLVGLRARDIPVVFPRAHDCITFFMGSKERYARYFGNTQALTTTHPAGWSTSTAGRARSAHAGIRPWAVANGQFRRVGGKVRRG